MPPFLLCAIAPLAGAVACVLSSPTMGPRAVERDAKVAQEGHFDPRARLTQADLDAINKPFQNPERHLFSGAYEGVPTGIAFWPPRALKAIQAHAEKNKDVRVWLDQQLAIAAGARQRPSHPRRSKDRLLEESTAALRDFEYVIRFALDYRINDNAGSLKKAEEYLLAWARRYEPGGDPIDEEPFVGYVMGYELVRDSISREARRATDILLRNLYNRQIEFASKGIRIDNKVSRHLLLVGSIAFLIGGEAQKRYVDTMFQIQLDYNFYKDGSSYDYHLRDSLAYHVATVQALYQLAWVAENNGLPWFRREGSQGQSLNKEVEFVIPYVTGELRRKEFAGSFIPSDKGREADLDPKVARRLVTLAVGLDDRYRRYASVGSLEVSAVVLYLTLANPALT